MPYLLFRSMLEERYRTLIQMLVQLTASSRMPNCGGYEPAALAVSVTSARHGVAEAADALQRISDGTYGACERCGRRIPPGHLRMQPDARYCVPCDRLQARGLVADTSADVDPVRFARSGQRTETPTTPAVNRPRLAQTSSPRRHRLCRGARAQPEGSSVGARRQRLSGHRSLVPRGTRDQ